ncbi:hypothetical protein N657DRAFT_502804 [Parathielavia appendiculata]|uniref:Uncharacterized protein n=1 Tax=Parathielavia appendiculata TaxID=2587402 RepID=A0AAN6TY52_9PEZI|nr:hypothetical protein N657DRAFT_502804 [Parathielavia appendiculata]
MKIRSPGCPENMSINLPTALADSQPLTRKSVRVILDLEPLVQRQPHFQSQSKTNISCKRHEASTRFGSHQQGRGKTTQSQGVQVSHPHLQSTRMRGSRVFTKSTQLNRSMICKGRGTMLINVVASPVKNGDQEQELKRKYFLESAARINRSWVWCFGLTAALISL